MPSFGGLISGVLGSAAKGVGEVAERESLKNAQLDLRKQLAEAEDDMTKRVEERRRLAGITEEERKMSPEFINKQGAADLARSKLATQNQAALATDLVAAEKAKVKALMDSGLSEDKAKLEAADWAAGEQNRLTKAAEATKAKITETTGLAGSKDYIEGLGKISKASDASKITVASIQEQGRRDRLSLGSSGSDDKPETSMDLERRSKAAKDALATQLGVPLNKVNEELAYLKDAAAKGDENAKAKLARLQSRIDAVERTGQDVINYSRKRKPDNAASAQPKDRPPIGSFKQP
jgi:hypothetical protein